MNKPMFLVLGLLLSTFTMGTFAQTMETYESQESNLQFQVPAKWTTETSTENDIPQLESESPDKSVYMYVYTYKDATISTRDLYDQTVKDLGFRINGKVQKENINGFEALVGEGVATVKGEKVGMFIMAATYNEDNHVAYIFTEEAKFDANAKVMNAILDSFTPIKK